MDLRFLKLKRKVDPSDVVVNETDGVTEVYIQTDGVDTVLVNGTLSDFTIVGPYLLTVPSTEVETISITLTVYDPRRPAVAEMEWRGGFMDGVEQLLFDLLRAMFSSGGLSEYLKTLDTGDDIRAIVGHIQVATRAAISDIQRRQASRNVPNSRRPTRFELTGVDAQGTTLALSFELETRTSNLEFSLWL